MGRVGYGRAAALVNNNPNQELKDRLEQRVLQVSSVLDSDTTLTRAHAGSIILISGNAYPNPNFTLTLPTPVVGMKFTFLQTTVTGEEGVPMIDAGAGVLIVGCPSNDQNNTAAVAYSDRRIVPEGDPGTHLEIVAVSTTKWMIINSSANQWSNVFPGA